MAVWTLDLLPRPLKWWSGSNTLHCLISPPVRPLAFAWQILANAIFSREPPLPSSELPQSHPPREMKSIHTLPQAPKLRTPSPHTSRSSGSWSPLCCPASKATASAFSPTARLGLGRPTAWRWEEGNLGGSWGQGLGREHGCGTPPHSQGPPENPGIAPRALQSLFREMRTGGQHRVTLSMVEIYNEAVRSAMPCCLLPASGP